MNTAEVKLEFDLDVCRTCLSPGACVPLFGACGDSVETDDALEVMLEAVAGVRAARDDGLPARLCARCEGELRAASAYRRTALRADGMLRDALDRYQPCADAELDLPSPDTCQDPVPAPAEVRKRRKKRGQRGVHQCVQCGLEAASASALEAHSRTHSGVRPFVCPDCGRAFAALGNLRRHAAQHTPRERHFVCDACGRAFYRKSDIQAHMRTHSGEQPYACPHCPKRFSQFGSLARHERAHSSERRYGCLLCPKRFTDRDLLRKHRMVHSDRRDFVCHLCSKAFKSRTALNAHIDLHSGERSHVCAECGRAFTVKGNLVKHVMRLHGAGASKAVGERVPCPACPLAFSSRGSCKAHAAARHGPPSHRCAAPGCGAAFPLPRMLRHHWLKAHSGAPPPLPCPAPRCQRAFYRPSDRSRHQRAAHPDLASSTTHSDLTDQHLVKNKDIVSVGFSPDACINIYGNVLS